MLRARVALALLALASLGASAAGACDRRLRDLLPAEETRTPIEARLLTFVQELEACVFQLSEEPPGERREKALTAWEELYAEARETEPSSAMAVSPEEYRLILESVAGYARRLRAAWSTGDAEAAKRHEYNLQHVVLELYGSNPGRISKARAVHYTVTTFDHLPPPTPISIREWQVRARLLQLRFERWCAEIGANADHLGSVRLLRSGLAGLRARLDAIANPTDVGAEPLRWFLGSEVQAAVQDLAMLALRAPGAVLRASWSRNGVPKDLQVVPPRDKYPTLDRPPGT